MPDYLPRAKVRLIIRFDEFGKKVFTGKVPKKPAKNAKGIKDERAPLVVSKEVSEAGFTRYVLQPAGGSGGPQDQEGSDDGLTHVIDGIVPAEAKLSRNGLRIADTFECKIRFIDMPVDPRTVRAVGVKFFLGTVPDDEEDFGAGVVGLLPDEYYDDKGRRRTNLRFEGFGDKWENDFSETGEPMVRIQCRDNTSILIDEEAPPKLAVEAKEGIGLAVANYVAHFPQCAGMAVEYRAIDRGAPEPRLGDSLSKTAFRPELGPPASKGGGAGAGSKTSVWDYLTDTVGALGHMIRVEGTTIIIQRARTLYSSDPSAQRRADDPFDGSRGWALRRWVYGSDVQSMKFSRSFTRTAPKNVECRSYSPRRKKVLVGRFPSTGDTVADAKPGGIGQDEKWTVIPVVGIENEDTLRIIAQNYYEQVGRNELEVRLKTRELASFGGGNSDPDVLDMLAGDAFELLTRRAGEDEEHASVTRIEEALSAIDRSVEFMRALGFPEPFSRAYAKAYADAGFQTIYRAKTIETSWRAENEGVELEIVGANYVEVRADKVLEGGK